MLLLKHYFLNKYDYLTFLKQSNINKYIKYFYLYKRLISIPGYLEVPSSLRWLARNAGPQFPVDSSSGTLTGRQACPLFDVPDPVVSGAPSWSFSVHFAFHCCSKEIIFSFYMAKISEFSLLDIF